MNVRFRIGTAGGRNNILIAEKDVVEHGLVAHFGQHLSDFEKGLEPVGIFGAIVYLC